MTAPTPPPADSRDARMVEQFAARMLWAMDEGADDDAVFMETGDDPLIGWIEKAKIDYRVAAAHLLAMPGYLVLPDDVTERLAKRLAWRSWHGFQTSDYPLGTTPDELWVRFVPRVQENWLTEARSVLGALAERPSGGAG